MPEVDVAVGVTRALAALLVDPADLQAVLALQPVEADEPVVETTHSLRHGDAEVVDDLVVPQVHDVEDPGTDLSPPGVQHVFEEEDGVLIGHETDAVLGVALGATVDIEIVLGHGVTVVVDGLHTSNGGHEGDGEDEVTDHEILLFFIVEILRVRHPVRMPYPLDAGKDSRCRMLSDSKIKRL